MPLTLGTEPSEYANEAFTGLTLAGSDAVVATSGTAAPLNSTAVQLGRQASVRLQIVVSAFTSLTSIAFTLQTSHDNGATDTFRTVGNTISAQTANGTFFISAGGVDQYIRVLYTVVGTGTVTVTYTGDAV